ncbi:cytochrome P450 [Streptomyces sp. NPDC093598]|uniref:cytochrome P450 family protein n=1 Tax=Streptomyces sp. NPDC093598 TaxID=3366046 RepID=UPI00380E4873
MTVIAPETVELTSELISDPERGYTALRRQAPLVRVTLPGIETPVWLITRYEDARAALADPRFVRDQAKVPGYVQDGPSIAQQMIDAYGLPAEYRDYLGIMVLVDGAEHTRLRALVTKSFTARRINALRPRLEQITADLIAPLAARQEAELLEDVGYPLASTVICALIGVDEPDVADMRTWIREYASGDPELFVPALRNMVEYARGLIARRRAQPADDLVSAWIASGDEADGGLTETEMVALVLLLVNTGITPPALFIAASVLALLDHPDQLARLRAEPELITRAVPELLRFTSPVPMGAPLYATEDLEFAGMPVRKGEAVTSALLAANHDPEEFTAPEKLDITRDLGRGVGHVAFGHSAHYCIGAALARLEAEVVLDQLLVKRPGLTLGAARDELEYFDLPGEGRHLRALPVRL